MVNVFCDDGAASETQAILMYARVSATKPCPAKLWATGAKHGPERKRHLPASPQNAQHYLFIIQHLLHVVIHFESANLFHSTSRASLSTTEECTNTR